MTVKSILDYKLRICLEDLPAGVAEDITAALTIPNQEKAEAEKQKLWGWERMPDEIELWTIDREGPREYLVCPRGFFYEFVNGMDALGLPVKWEDRRTWKALFRVGNRPTPNPWQEKAYLALIENEQGIYKAPAGSGKTVTILIMIHRLACKSLVIVNTKDIMWQWQERVRDHLGPDFPEPGQIGDGIFRVSPYITIATAQTLHSRFDELEDSGFFDEFSLVCLDECHHAQAGTYNRVLDRFSARYRVGVSATPDKTGDFALAQAVLGPVVHTTKPAEVTNLIRPKVVRIPTKFGFGFRGTESRWRRSNYPQMIDALIRNPDRNLLIAKTVMREAGHHQLLVSKRLEHLSIIEEMLRELAFPDPIVKIRGVDDAQTRQDAKELAEREPCLLLSTLADEAMDIPRLDRLHLPYPQRNPGLVTQQVGRVERKHPDKKDAIIFDYCDLNVGPLDAQWKVRRTEVYMPRGYDIDTWKGGIPND